MKRQLMFGTMLSAALAVGVAAQQPPPAGAPTGASPQPPGGDRPAAQSMTVTGCLEAASAAGGAPAAAAEPGAPGAKAAGGFVLTNVTAGSAAPGAKTPGAATGTTGAGATGTSGSAASRYRLTGGESQNLQQYVGQKVEVTGSIAGGAGSPSAAPGAAGSPAGASASGSGRQDQALRVSSVRPTGDKCNQ
jgi:hypothetical protein